MKKLFSLLLVLLLVTALAVSAYANTKHVYDEAGLLTPSQQSLLESKLSQTSETWAVDVLVVTVDTLDGLSTEQRATQYKTTEDCVVLLVAMGSRDVDIVPFGICQEAFIASEQDRILDDHLVPLLSQGDYYEAFCTYDDLCNEVMEIYNTEISWVLVLAVSAIFGLVVALIVTGIMRSRLKSVRTKHAASDYVRRDTLRLTDTTELFLYSHVTRTPRPKENSSSGSYRSGGGGSRGGSSGGSRKF